MKPKLVYLDEKQIKKLEDERVDTGVNSSELIRRLLKKYFEEKIVKQK